MQVKVLIIDDDQSRFFYLKDALVNDEITSTYPSIFTDADIYESDNYIQEIADLAKKNNLADLYFYIFKIIEKQNIDIVFMDMHLKAHEDNKTTGETLIEIILSNVLHKKLPIIAYSRNIDDTSKLHDPINMLGKGVRFVPVDSSSSASDMRGAISGNINNQTFEALINKYCNSEYDYNLAIITALQKEMEPVKSFIGEIENITSSDGKRFKKGYIENKDTSRILKVVFKTPDEAGDLTAQNIAQTMIQDFRPRYIAMTGIAGGFRDNVQLGDVVIVRHSFNWQQGKYEGSKFLQRAEPLIIDKSLKRIIKEEFMEDFKDEKFTVETFLDKFESKEEIESLKLQEKINKFKFRFGPFATGSAVVASKEKGQSILDLHDKAGGLDMEIYAIYKAAYESNIGVQAIAIKGIVDYIDESKGDDWHEFASYSSAQTLYKLFTEYIDAEPQS